MRYVLLALMSFVLTACSQHAGFYGRKGDVLEKSPCVTECQGEPFYRNGQWLEER